MIFKDLEEKLNDLIKSSLQDGNHRILRVNFSPALRDIIKLTAADLNAQYKVYSLSDLEVSEEITKEETDTTIKSSIIKKMIICVLGYYFPVAVLLTLTDIAKTTADYLFKKSEFRLLKGKLNLHNRPKKKQKKISHILLIKDLSFLTEDQIKYITFLVTLVQRRYLTSIAIIIFQPDEAPIPLTVDNIVETNFELNRDTLESLIEDNLQSDKENLIEILNIIGIKYLPMLQDILCSDVQTKEQKIAVIVNQLIANTGITKEVKKSEIDHFLKLCSLLFETFHLSDVEKTFPEEGLPVYRLMESAINACLLQNNSGTQSYQFIERFIREYYQNNLQLLFRSDVYDKLFIYLKDNYQDHYTDLAFLAELVGKPQDEQFSYWIVAFYHDRYKLPWNRKKILLDKIGATSYGKNLLSLNHLYETLSQTDEAKALLVCKENFISLDNSRFTIEASLCVLGLIYPLLYEIHHSVPFGIEVMDKFFKIFEKIPPENWENWKYTEYIIDALLFSTCVEKDFVLYNKIDRLQKLLKEDEKIPIIKRIRFYRLGNVLNQADRKKGLQLTKTAYQISEEYGVEHEMSRINYSASLLCMGKYEEGAQLLSGDPCELKNFNINTYFAHRNNYLVAKALQGKDSRRKIAKEFEELYSQIETTQYGDAQIVKSNYISALIFYYPQKKANRISALCEEVLRFGEDYHSFYANYNLLILSCLTADKKQFDEVSENWKTPKIFRIYTTFFKRKIGLISEHFKLCTSIAQIDRVLTPLKDEYPDDWFSLYYGAIHWGLIERWFE